MELLNDVLPRMAKLDTQSDSQRYLEMTSTANLIAALLKQSVERIDKVRSIAGKVLCELILNTEHLQYPGQDYLESHIHS